MPHRSLPFEKGTGSHCVHQLSWMHGWKGHYCLRGARMAHNTHTSTNGIY